MKRLKYFKSKKGRFPLPIFFPDATRAVVKALDLKDVSNTKIQGILVNTYHLYSQLGDRIIEEFGGIGKFMGWDKALVSDSGGFQIMSLAKSDKEKVKVSDYGITFKSDDGKNITLTPEKSIQFQMALKTDLVVVLDDFGTPGESYKNSKESMERTIEWAKRSKVEFEKICRKKRLGKRRPYLLGVVHGGDYEDLRRDCARNLVNIGFDGLGYGGWIKDQKRMHYIAKVMSEEAPKNYFLFGLGVGKPEDIVYCSSVGFQLFDCVLPTRDARHGRLYVYNARSIDKINLKKKYFYSFYKPDRNIYQKDKKPVSRACDCLLCTNYSRAYLYHLFKIKEQSAFRLATIHNLRFYSILMELLR